MRRSQVGAIVIGLLATVLVCSEARAKLLVVDDDNIPCFSGQAYHTINEALGFADNGDTIDVCPGIYAEQVVLTKSITLQGLPEGSQQAVIMPASLPASRLSTQGAKPIRAAIIVDAPRVVLVGLTVDLSVANLSGCAPIVAGIYLRNASGVLDNLTETGAHATGATDCDTGVGLLIEGGKLTDDFGKPVNRKAVVSLRDSAFHDNQKGGIVATGDGTIIKIRDTGVFGQGATSIGVPNGIELSFGVKARLQAVQVRDFQSPVAGKTGTGILAFGASKARLRQSTLTGMQTGVFVVGDGLRILDSQLGEFSSDGMVFIGSKNRGLGNRIEVSSVSGVFIDGDRNTVRGGNITDMPVGVWFFSGDRNIAKGIDFENVAQPERVGDVRDLSSNSVSPLNLKCAALADCDDANPCTTDACDTSTGACTFTNLPNLTSCADATVCNGNEVCVAGQCQAGTPLICVDGNECTQDVCDPILACQNPAVADGTACAAGAGMCVAGVCS